MRVSLDLDPNSEQSQAFKAQWGSLTPRYREWPEGFFAFCEENVCIPIYPEGKEIAEWFLMGDLPDTINPKTGKSYRSMWEEQKEVLREALRMEDGRFVYKLVVFCWMRGEGKSLVACLIKIGKFFCWPKQEIVLGANSKDQIKFVHYDIIRDIILHSPRLMAILGSARNIKEKEIVLSDDQGRPMSRIRAISSFSGIVSNITGYTFSEIFDMKNPKFFVQLDGSTRNIPNAMGVIDSTVSKKDHVLYKTYLGCLEKKTKLTYFSYRSSVEGNQKDFWNPNMTKDQLEDYRVKFPFGEFERYFQNLWSAGSITVFSEEMVEAWHYWGMDGVMGNQKELILAFEKRNRLREQLGELSGRRLEQAAVEVEVQMAEIDKRVIPVTRDYQLIDKWGNPTMATIDMLQHLGDMFDTDWAVGVGLDRADPMKARTAARTIGCCVAKGLAGSRTNIPQFMQEKDPVPLYIYVLLHFIHVEDSDIETVKTFIRECHHEYDGLDVVCGERWGLFDIVQWCEDSDIKPEIVWSSYDRQREAFSEVFTASVQGRFKKAPLAVRGSKDQHDILCEEALIFDHDPDTKTFGSPEKGEKYGIQDDAMYALAWCFFGMKGLGVNEFRSRKGQIWWGQMVYPKGLRGRY